MLDEMRTFVLLSEEGSIQRVAERVHLTQPAVTRQIQRLEQALGVALLDRRQKPPRLTPAGREALSRCRQILDTYSDMRRIGRRGEPEGLLRVGIAHGLADDRLATVINSLRQTYRKVSFQLTAGWSDVLVGQFRQGKLDVVYILSDPSGTSSGEGTVIGLERLAIIASRAVPQAPAFSTTLLAECPWILSPEPCDGRRHLVRALASHRLNVVAEVQDARLQVALVREGLGLSLLPVRQLRSRPVEGITAIEPPDLNLTLNIEARRSPHLRDLDQVVDALTAQFVELIDRPECLGDNDAASPIREGPLRAKKRDQGKRLASGPVPKRNEARAGRRNAPRR